MKNCSRENIIVSPSRQVRRLKHSNDDKRIVIDCSVSKNSHKQIQRPPQQVDDSSVNRPIFSLPINCDDVTYAIVPDFKIARKLLRRRHIMKERRERREALEHAERERKRQKSDVSVMSNKLISGINVVEDSSLEDRISSHDDEQTSLYSFEERREVSLGVVKSD